MLRNETHKNFENHNIYVNSDEKTKGRFRAKKSYWLRKGMSENEAFSKAVEVFDCPNSNSSLQLKSSSRNLLKEPIENSINSKTSEPTKLEIESEIRRLTSMQDGANEAFSNQPIKLNSVKYKNYLDQPTPLDKKKDKNGLFGALNRLFKQLIEHKYLLIKLCLYALIVPITAGVIQAALSNSGLKAQYVEVLSWLLAFIIDFIALDHLSKVKDFRACLQSQFNAFVAAFIVAANLLGAYLLFEKEMKVAESQLVFEESEVLKEKIEDSERRLAETKSLYLATKWPAASDPSACENNRTNACGRMFAERAKAQKINYLTARTELQSLQKKLTLLKTTSPPKASQKDLWWHFGYYVFIWLLIAAVIRLEKISVAE